MGFETIKVEIETDVAVLTLNRPDKLNSFTRRMHEEIMHALTSIERRAERALVITGAGRGFCAGQDLSERRSDGDGGGEMALNSAIETYYNPLIRKIRALRMPVICAVNGVAAGAGANVALACDIVLAARSASFIQAFAKIGLVPDAGGTWTLTQVIGPARARALAMLAEPLSSERAEAWGLIYKAVDDEVLMDEAMTLARYLAKQPTLALAAIKQAIDAAVSNDLHAQLDMERDLQARMMRTEDYREGVKAFLEKRQPNFTGR